MIPVFLTNLKPCGVAFPLTSPPLSEPVRVYTFLGADKELTERGFERFLRKIGRTGAGSGGVRGVSFSTRVPASLEGLVRRL